MLITVQPNPSWQLSLAQLSPSLFVYLLDVVIVQVVLRILKTDTYNLASQLSSHPVVLVMLCSGWDGKYVAIYGHKCSVLGMGTDRLTGMAS